MLLNYLIHRYFLLHNAAVHQIALFSTTFLVISIQLVLASSLTLDYCLSLQEVTPHEPLNYSCNTLEIVKTDTFISYHSDLNLCYLA